MSASPLLPASPKGHLDRVPAQRASWIELAAIVPGLAALLAIQLLVSRSWTLLTQTPWLDESLTFLVINDSSFWHGLAAIRGGVENTPPAFFVVVWPFARISGGLSSVELRVLNCFFILLGCVAVYGACRLFTERQRAVMGALVIAIHPAVVVQMFQVRFYGFWLALCAWLVYATTRHVLEPERRGLLFARCALAALVVASHWFGVIALTLITVGDFLVPRTARQRRASVMPMVVGIVTLGLCFPLLSAQRSGLAVPTWIEPLSVQDIAVQVRSIFGPAPMLLLGAFAVWRVVERRSQKLDAARWAAIAPGLALLLFPVVLIVLSIVMQPVLRSKYMIPTVIPIGLLAAFLCPPATARGGRGLAALAGIGMAVIGTLEMRELRRGSAADVIAIERAVTAADSLRAGGVPLPIVFLRRFEQHPVIQQRPGLAAATAFVDFEGDGGGLSRMWVFERDMARRVNRVYPQYRLASTDHLGRLPQFFVIARSQDEHVLRRLFPDHDILPRSVSVYVAIRR